MVVNPERQTAIAATGVIPVLLASMRAHVNHADLLEPSCRTLCVMGHSDKNIIKEIREGVDVLQAALLVPGLSNQLKCSTNILLRKLV